MSERELSCKTCACRNVCYLLKGRKKRVEQLIEITPQMKLLFKSIFISDVKRLDKNIEDIKEKMIDFVNNYALKCSNYIDDGDLE